MPGKLTQKEEKLWNKAKKQVAGKKKPKKKDWPLIQHIFQKMKNASNIRVEPYEKLIEEGISLVEEVYGSGFFSGIKNIIVEHNHDHHYGRVFSDKKDQIFISADRIKAEFADSHLEQVYQIASTLVHEMAHIKDNLQNGEGPAISAEQRFLSDFQNKVKTKPEVLDKLRKSASLQVFAKAEDSGISDKTGKIFVTTAARLVFRKQNPEWAHVPNSFLNPVIAEKFKELPVVKQFKAKQSGAMGEIRGDKQNRITSITNGSAVAIVAIKGSFKIRSPKTASRDDALRKQKGWFENHFFDIFIGQLALDERSATYLKDYIQSGIGIDQVSKMSSEQLSQLAAAVLSEDQRGQMHRDPGVQTGAIGSTALPIAFSL